MCGLISVDRLRSESLAIPYTVGLWFAFFGLLILLSVPLLKVAFMDSQERLSRWDGLWLIVCSLLVTALLTFCLLGVDYFYFHTQINKQLKDLAFQINTNINNELNKLSQQLRVFNQQLTASCSKKASHDACENLLVEAEQSKEKEGGPSKKEPFLVSRCNLTMDIAKYYPFFDSAVWLDKKGWQRFKWTVKQWSTPIANVSDREYFRAITEQRFWSREESPDEKFHLESLYSKNTAENIAVFSMPFKSNNEDPDDPCSLAVATISTRPLSLIRPYVPPGFGFAVIDPGGKVLFHSEEIRNLRENFFEECDQDKMLRAAVFGRVSQLVNTNYLGKSHCLLVTPIQGIEGVRWTLIVYRDRTVDKTVNLQVIIIGATLFFFYFVAILIFYGLFLSLGPKNAFTSMLSKPAAWIWPDPGLDRFYGNLNLVFLAAIIVYCGCILHCPPFVVLGGSFTIPLCALLLSFLLYSYNSTPSLGISRLFTYRFRCVFATFLLLILVGVLPCVAFFKLACDYEMKVLIKHSQFDLMRHLEERADRISRKYEGINMKDKDLVSFLDKRLKLSKKIAPGHDATDLYPTVFYGTEPQEDGRGGSCGDSHESRLDKFFGSIRWFYNQFTVETQGLINPAPECKAWGWCSAASSGPGMLRLVKKGYRGNRTLEISSQLPAVHILSNWWGLGMLAILLAALYEWLCFIAGKIFLFSFEEAFVFRQDDLLPPSGISQNLLVLRSPFTSSSVERSQREDLVWIDLGKVARSGAWEDALENPSVTTDKMIVLDGFEYGIDDAACNVKKIELLEKLVYEKNKATVILSTIDPLFYLSNNHFGKTQQSINEESKLIDRLEQVLSLFSKRRFEEPTNYDEFEKILSQFSRKLETVVPPTVPRKAKKAAG